CARCASPTRSPPATLGFFGVPAATGRGRARPSSFNALNPGAPGALMRHSTYGRPTQHRDPRETRRTSFSVRAGRKLPPTGAGLSGCLEASPQRADQAINFGRGVVVAEADTQQVAPIR